MDLRAVNHGEDRIDLGILQKTPERESVGREVLRRVEGDLRHGRREEDTHCG